MDETFTQTILDMYQGTGANDWQNWKSSPIDCGSAGVVVIVVVGPSSALGICMQYAVFTDFYRESERERENIIQKQRKRTIIYRFG